jgi:hypothetical protein
MTSARLYTLPAGTDVRKALLALGDGMQGWLTASGTLEALELRIDGVPRRIDGKSAIVSLSGPCGGPYMIALSRSGQVLAGELDNARSAGMTLCVIPGEIAEAPRARERSTTTAASAPPPSSSPKPQPAVGGGWAASALASAEVTREAEPDDVPNAMPGAGDLVDHFAFGLCQVLMGDEDSLKIRDLHGRGRIREIRTEMLKITGPTARDGKRLFKLARKN